MPHEPGSGVTAGRFPSRARILLIDDERNLRLVLRDFLESRGFDVVEAEDVAVGWLAFERGVDVALLDFRLPDGTGLDLLRRMMAVSPDLPVILMTGFSSVEQAVEAMREGAYHYVSKPLDLGQIALVIDRALRSSRLQQQVRALQAGAPGGVESLVGDSEAMQRTRALLERVAQSPTSTVLLTGESGTGKDLAAHAVHQSSARRDGPFLNVTCSAMPATLLESELFGHERGAFTDARTRKRGLLEQAHGGTVFLDEIGELPLDAQAKLNRFLEEKTFRRVGGATDIRADVRVIAATNVDLKQATRLGAFRGDLFYRLAVITVELPPLRERVGDIALLVEHFIGRFNREFHKLVRRVAPATMTALALHPWPGNVRELRNAIERAMLLCDGTTLTRADFGMLAPSASPRPAAAFELPPEGVDLETLEQSMVQQALERCRGNRTLAAALLGLNRDQIRYRIRKFGLEPPGDSAPPRDRG